MASMAIRFARSLTDVVLAKQQAAAVQAELQHFSRMLSESKELFLVLTNPSVANTQKKNLVEAIASRSSYSVTTQNFLKILVDHHRVNLFKEILAAFQRELDRRLGIESVEVTTAVPLEEEQQKVLAERLRSFTQKEVRLQFQSDPQLIGGLVARIGSTIYDGSIREQLQRLQTHLGSE